MGFCGHHTDQLPGTGRTYLQSCPITGFTDRELDSGRARLTPMPGAFQRLNSVRLKKQLTIHKNYVIMPGRSLRRSKTNRLRTCHAYNPERILEAISKKSFGPISVLGPRFKSSTYLSMSAGWNSAPPLRGVGPTRRRLDLEPKSFFWDGF